MAYTNTDFAAFQQMRRINPSKYHNQKTRKTMNATYRDVGLSEFFGIDTDDLTPVTEAEGTMDLPELILLASNRLEAGDLLFNELTDTTLGCLYATGQDLTSCAYLESSLVIFWMMDAYLGW